MHKLAILFLAVITVVVFSGASFGEVYDNFSGTTINEDKWHVIDPANEVSQNDGLIMKWNDIRDHGMLVSTMKYSANQDFEVSASWSKFAVDGTRNTFISPPPAMAFQIGAPETGDYVYIRQKFENDVAEFQSYDNHGNGQEVSTTNPNPYNTGTFSIKREGSTVNVYWNGDLFQSYPNSITGKVNFQISGYSGSQDYQLDGVWSSVSATAAPEPVSMLLFGAGGLTLAAFRRKKKSL